MRHRRKCQFFEIATSNIPFPVSSRNGSADASRELNPLEGVAIGRGLPNRKKPRLEWQKGARGSTVWLVSPVCVN